MELLDLQSADSALDRLRRQRDEIPERAEADALREDAVKLDGVVAAIEAEEHESERTQSRLESEIAVLSDKIAGEEKKLYGGAVVNPKELGSIQEEVRMLKGRRDELETSLLEAMEAGEQIGAKVAEASARRDALAAELAAKEGVFSERAAELDAQIETQLRAREAATGKVESGLLTKYDKIREQKGGTAVGEVREGVCGACRVELPSEEVDRMTKSDELWLCPQCRRILVERR